MWSWTQSEVGRKLPHLVLAHDEHVAPVALVGAPVGDVFPVEFLVSPDSDHEAMQKVVADTVRELDFYLTDVGRPNPWAYAIYHFRTASNLYSRVHWSYVDPEAS